MPEVPRGRRGGDAYRFGRFAEVHPVGAETLEKMQPRGARDGAGEGDKLVHHLSTGIEGSATSPQLSHPLRSRPIIFRVSGFGVREHVRAQPAAVTPRFFRRQ
jgi:hypothetical protein